MYRYAAKDRDAELYNGRRIEIQVRTRLQHAWATAVEGVGLVDDVAIERATKEVPNGYASLS